jgi:hypothetical protein
MTDKTSNRIADAAHQAFNGVVDGLVIKKLGKEMQLPSLPSGVALSGGQFAGAQVVASVIQDSPSRNI